MTADKNSPPVICLRDVSFAYDNTPVLEHVNLDVHRGDFVCAVGPNGGGKTTLLKLVLGLLSPTSGAVRVWGQDVGRMLGRIGYVPQHVQHDLLFPVTVGEVVQLGRGGRGGLGWPGVRERKKMRETLAEVGLADMADRPFRALSGGQRQRVLVARALAGDPELLLLDEPTANIDPAREKEFENLLRHLSERMTVFLVSHDLRFVSDMAETVVCVNRRVHVHPTSQVTLDSIGQVYGQPIKVILHDRRLEHGDHNHA